MMFIGDFGWFYLAARDMLETGIIPLVGIPSSQSWLHQGPFWTYILGFVFMLSDFHPLSGGIAAVIFGILSILLMYELASRMYTDRIGLLASLLYATSPLIIIHARMPYHTAPIPFFTLLFMYGVYRFITGSPYFFALALFSLSVLYNFELVTVIYIMLLIIVLVYGIVKRKEYIRKLQNSRVVFFSVISALLPMFPILLYDTTHGFLQTLKFGVWMGYRVSDFFEYSLLHSGINGSTMFEVVVFFFQHIQKLLFLPGFFSALLLLLFALIWFIRRILTTHFENKLQPSDVVLGLFLLVGLGGFFASGTVSEAYLPMLFPQMILLIALLFGCGFASNTLRYFFVPLFFLIISMNTLSLLQTNYLMAIPVGGYGPTFAQRIKTASFIITETDRKRYTIEGVGNGSEFQSYLMNYEYLLWYLGNEPSESGDIRFQIEDTPMSVRIEVHD